MDKLTHSIQQIRVSEKTKKGIAKLAQLNKRKESDFIRVILDLMAEEHEKMQEKNKRYLFVRYTLF